MSPNQDSINKIQNRTTEYITKLFIGTILLIIAISMMAKVRAEKIFEDPHRLQGVFYGSDVFFYSVVIIMIAVAIVLIIPSVVYLIRKLFLS